MPNLILLDSTAPSGRWSEILLEIRPNVLFSSIAYGFFATVLLCAKPFETINIDVIRNPVLDGIASNAGVCVIQFVSILVVLVWAFRYYRATSGLSKRAVILALSSSLVLITLGELLLEYVFIKPSFRYGTVKLLGSFGQISESGWLIDSQRPDRYAAPSGFVMRQTIVLLTFLLLSHQKRWRAIVSRKWNRALHWLMYGFFCTVVFLRIYGGRPSLFDIGTAIGSSVTLFWFTVLLWSLALGKDRKAVEYAREATLPLAACGILILFYCQETKLWLWVMVGLFLSLGLLERMRSRDMEKGMPTQQC